MLVIQLISHLLTYLFTSSILLDLNLILLIEALPDVLLFKILLLILACVKQIRSECIIFLPVGVFAVLLDDLDFGFFLDL